MVMSQLPAGNELRPEIVPKPPMTMMVHDVKWTLDDDVEIGVTWQ